MVVLVTHYYEGTGNDRGH